MSGISAHERLAAAAFAKGKATATLLEIHCLDPDPAQRRIALIALGLRHPIYSKQQ